MSLFLDVGALDVGPVFQLKHLLLLVCIDVSGTISGWIGSRGTTLIAEPLPFIAHMVTPCALNLLGSIVT